MNRPILTGTIQSTNTRVQMETAVNAYIETNLYETRTTSSTHHYYTQNSFPNSAFPKTYLSVTYYDDYDINNDGTGSGDPLYTTDADFPNNAAFSRLKNKVTVSKARELDPASSSEVWFTTATFYDKRYRIIQTKTTGIQGGSNLVTNEINFPGWLIKSKESQTVAQGTTTLTNYVLTRNEYDHQGRLVNTYHKINTGTERNISNLSYNELGQLLSKKLHVTSGTGLQKTDYTYNIKGWLKKINEPDLSGGEGDFFGIELLYNEGFAALNGTAMNGAAAYNGNISGIKWKNGNSGSTQKGYGFIYDQINRLTTSKYGEGTSYTTNVNRYRENIAYDKNGNILKLLRSGQISTGVFGRLDSLTYKYTGMGNQVRSIADSVPDVAGRGDFYDATNGYTSKEYYYDKNGNMWLDRNKRMKTVYNYLNLPARISDTINTANKIEYVYTSAGEKLKQRLSTGTTLLYFGNYVYTLDGTANGIALKYILTQEGRATYSAGTYTYEYFMKDHLGNTRVSFNVPSSTAVIVQQNDYYPFGMIHQPRSTATSDNRYLYNGKELQNNLLGGINLDWYDYGARFYDPQIGRWNVVDPLSDKYYSLSPYCYVGNNPLNFIDPNGMVIDSLSQKQWDREKQRITNRMDKLEQKNKNGKYDRRIASLGATLNTMGILEGSEQVYSLSSAQEIGDVSLDPTTKKIVISYAGTANFVHELKHAEQFESRWGHIAFDGSTGKALGVDIYDETQAYRAQWAYSPSSVSGLPSVSTITINTMDDISPNWVQGLRGGNLYIPIGHPNYIPNVSANTASGPIYINSTKADFIRAYPNYPAFNNLPNNYTLLNYPNIYYKK